MEVPLWSGGRTTRTEVDPAFLGDRVKSRTLREAVIMYEANLRVGTHSTLRRGEVARSKRQIMPQKGTGRARVRHPQVTQCRGGGRPHGPKPRNYGYQLPRRELRVALRSAVLSKFRDGEVAVVESFGLSKPRTREVAAVLDGLGCGESCLIVTDRPDDVLVRSARNLPRVKVASVAELNAYDVVYHRNLVLTAAGLERLRAEHSDA
jgi:large subunit ribosomal protein L4